MPTFYLVRHGTRVSRDEETKLSELGVRQAELTAQYFLDKDIQAIYASPLQRTQQTAAIISESIHIPVSPDDRLKERMIYDAQRGLSFDSFLREWDKTMGDRKYRPVYGDSAELSGKRLLSLIDEISDDSNTIFVSHAGVIGDVVRTLFSDEKLEFRHDPASQLKWVEIRECSITEIRRSAGMYSLQRVNDCGHLSF